MLTNNLSKILTPINDETLDEYLIRALKDKEIKQKLLQAVNKELESIHDEEIMMQLKRMQEILGNTTKKYGIHPDANGREAIWEVVFSRPANYSKPAFLTEKNVKGENER